MNTVGIDTIKQGLSLILKGFELLADGIDVHIKATLNENENENENINSNTPLRDLCRNKILELAKNGNMSKSIAALKSVNASNITDCPEENLKKLFDILNS